MDDCTFDTFVTQLAALTSGQCTRLLASLNAAIATVNTAGIIQAARLSHLRCPRCQGISFYRHGAANGLQRYRCRECGRSFNALTGTPLARLRHKAKWIDYLSGMLDSRTVRKAAAKVGVAKNTSMRWRHRFLAWTKNDRPAPLTGITEADETFLLESQKGARTMIRPARKHGGKASTPGISSELVCILVARDRGGMTWDFVTGRGPVTKAQLHRHLGPVLSSGTLLVTDGNRAYRTFAREAGVEHAYVNVSGGVRVADHPRGPVHVQNVDAYHSRFHGWLRRFNGVATRYLPNYLGWCWAIDRERIHSPETLLKAAVGVFHS